MSEFGVQSRSTHFCPYAQELDNNRLLTEFGTSELLKKVSADIPLYCEIVRFADNVLDEDKDTILGVSGKQVFPSIYVENEPRFEYKRGSRGPGFPLFVGLGFEDCFADKSFFGTRAPNSWDWRPVHRMVCREGTDSGSMEIFVKDRWFINVV